MCSNNAVVVMFSLAIKLLLLDFVVTRLAQLYYAVSVPNILKTNAATTQSLFLLQFLAYLVYPVCMTFYLDEASPPLLCLRALT